MNSIWYDHSNLPHFENLKENLNKDVLIIGGGMAGILCAYMLKQSGVDYALVEARTICSGVSGNTTAKITFQHGLIYHKLIKQYGLEKASMYLQANEAALEKYRQLCANRHCGFEETDAFVYAIDDTAKIEKELKALEQLRFSAEFVQDVPLPFAIAGAVKFKKQAQFNPLQFIAAIAGNLNIYENTMVKEIKGNEVVTSGGIITAKKVIVATHFPLVNKHGSYFLKLYQHRSYVLALEHAPKVNGIYVDEIQNGMSFRNYENLLLIGGGDHRTGKMGGNWQELRSFAAHHYPEADEAYTWAAQDTMTLDGIPYIGPYSMCTPDLYVAAGFNKWGMTSSMVSAMILADLVQGKKNLYAAVFSPSRTMLRPQLAVNALEATVNWFTISEKRCSHMGCALKWNEVEHSWDCPCHGSRFDKGGNLLDNPATKSLKS